jgi:hypothetical protein
MRFSIPFAWSAFSNPLVKILQAMALRLLFILPMLLIVAINSVKKKNCDIFFKNLIIKYPKANGILYFKIIQKVA